MSSRTKIRPIIKDAIGEAGSGVACSRFCAVYKFSFFLLGVFVEPTSSPVHSRLMYVVIPTVIGISKTPMLIWIQQRGGFIHDRDLKVELVSYLRGCPEVFGALCLGDLVEQIVSRAQNSQVTYPPSNFVAAVGSFIFQDGRTVEILDSALLGRRDDSKPVEEWDELILEAKSELRKGYDDFERWLIQRENKFLLEMWCNAVDSIHALGAGPFSVHTGLNTES